MLNIKQVKSLTEPQKDEIKAALDNYEQTKNALRLSQIVSRLRIIVELSCCGGMSIENKVKWINYLIENNFNV